MNYPSEAHFRQHYQALSDSDLLVQEKRLRSYLYLRESGFQIPEEPTATLEKKVVDSLLRERNLEPDDPDFATPVPGAREAIENSSFLNGSKNTRNPSSQKRKKDPLDELRHTATKHLIIGMILAFLGIGLSLDVKGFIFYGAVVTGIVFIGLSIWEFSELQKMKKQFPR